MRTVLRAILTLALLLGGGLGDWAADPLTPAAAAHESCCCGEPRGMEDACPCPKPEGTRGPSQNACHERATTVAAASAVRRSQAQRRVEPRPEPSSWAGFNAGREERAAETGLRGREPDLDRRLAALGTFRI